MVTLLPTMGYCKEFKKPTKPDSVCSGFVPTIERVSEVQCQDCKYYQEIDPEQPLLKDITGIVAGWIPTWLQGYEGESKGG